MIVSKAEKLFVHVGPAKTGTTALQKYLAGHAPEGLLYPEAGQWSDRSHHTLTLALGGFEEFIGHELSPAETIAGFKAEVRGADKPAIVSSEAIAALSHTFDTYLEQVVAFFRDCSDDVEFIYTLRHPLARAASLYKYVVCSFTYKEGMSPQDFMEDRAKLLLFDPFLSRLDDLGVRYRTVWYEPAQDFVPRFMEEIGYPVKGYDYQRENVSTSDDALPVMLCVNQVFDDKGVKKRVRREFEDEAKGFPAEAAAWPFDGDTVAWLDERVEADRAALEARGIEYPELKMKPQYRITDDKQTRIEAFLKARFQAFESALKPGVDPDAVLRDVIGMFR